MQDVASQDCCLNLNSTHSIEVFDYFVLEDLLVELVSFVLDLILGIWEGWLDDLAYWEIDLTETKYPGHEFSADLMVFWVDSPSGNSFLKRLSYKAIISQTSIIEICLGWAYLLSLFKPWLRTIYFFLASCM